MHSHRCDACVNSCVTLWNIVKTINRCEANEHLGELQTIQIMQVFINGGTIAARCSFRPPRIIKFPTGGAHSLRLTKRGLRNQSNRSSRSVCGSMFIRLLVGMKAKSVCGAMKVFFLLLPCPWIHSTVSSGWFCLYRPDTVNYHRDVSVCVCVCVSVCVWAWMLGKLTLGVVAWGHMLWLLEREREGERRREEPEGDELNE